MHEFDPENPLRIPRPDGKELDLRAGIKAQKSQINKTTEKPSETKGHETVRIEKRPARQLKAGFSGIHSLDSREIERSCARIEEDPVGHIKHAEF